MQELGLSTQAAGFGFGEFQRKPQQQSQPKKNQPNKDNGAAIFDGRSIEALKPKIIRAIAFALIGLTALGSALGLGGYQPGTYSNLLEEVVNQLTLKGVLLGLLLQAITFVIQFVWANNKLSGWWLGATSVSQYFSIKGFWFVGLAAAGSIGFSGAAQQVIGFLLVAAVTLTADIWPETKLVRR